MALVVTQSPSIEPVDLDDIKGHARVEITEDDALLSARITVAREWAESFTRRAFITQKWDLTLDAFPSRDDIPIKLPRPPLQTIDSIKYTDDAGVLQTWAASKYRVDNESEPARITPAFGEAYPITRTITNAVRVSFTAGYGVAPADVPQSIQHSIRLIVSHFYENTEETMMRALHTIPMGAKSLLWPQRRWLNL